MEDFFDAAFHAADFASSISRNTNGGTPMPRNFEMDNLLGFIGESGPRELIPSTTNPYSEDIPSTFQQSFYFRSKYDYF